MNACCESRENGVYVACVYVWEKKKKMKCMRPRSNGPFKDGEMERYKRRSGLQLKIAFVYAC